MDAKFVERPYPDRVREGIARALAVRDAKFGLDVLKRLYAGKRTEGRLRVFP